MISDADMLEEIDARLAAVADVQFALIQKIQGRIEASDDAAELQALAEPLDRCARSIRLTYALRVKLRKDIRSLDREETRRAEAAHRERSQDRWDAVRHRVETLTWREADWEDEGLLAEYDRVLDFESLDERFLDLTVEQQADRLIAKLDLRAEPPPSYPEAEAAEAREGFQSSA
ncbi:hypothetical protein ACO2Q0_06300 [Phenylobacterium sp. VNQ135]|uniref:hypothetical protein n=1 Tax=Phenylobacterium sp. VNQ135 TaxID=3400922 RepID=UPI003BFAD641